MVPSPESSQRKRRREDLPASQPWTYEHRPLHLTTKFPPQKLLKPRTASPGFSFSPKLKRVRVEGEVQASAPVHVQQQQRTPPERCHVCSRVQSLVMPAFGTVTACAVCALGTCYVCTRKCDGCEETVCSKCSEEKEVHSFCRRCMGDMGL